MSTIGPNSGLLIKKKIIYLIQSCIYYTSIWNNFRKRKWERFLLWMSTKDGRPMLKWSLPRVNNIFTLKLNFTFIYGEILRFFAKGSYIVIFIVACRSSFYFNTLFSNIIIYPCGPTLSKIYESMLHFVHNKLQVTCMYVSMIPKVIFRKVFFM